MRQINLVRGGSVEVVALAGGQAIRLSGRRGGKALKSAKLSG